MNAINIVGELRIREFLPKLVESLRIRDVQDSMGRIHMPCQRAAATALGRIGTEALEPVIGCLSSGMIEVRLHAILALEGMGAEGMPAIENLRPLLRDPDPQIREYAQRAISALENAK